MYPLPVVPVDGRGTFEWASNPDGGLLCVPDDKLPRAIGSTKGYLATANAGQNTVSVLLGNGGLSFGAKTDFATGSQPTALAIADLNADGRPGALESALVGTPIADPERPIEALRR